jgi:hypothetical protein
MGFENVVSVVKLFKVRLYEYYNNLEALNREMPDSLYFSSIVYGHCWLHFDPRNYFFVENHYLDAKSIKIEKEEHVVSAVNV